MTSTLLPLIALCAALTIYGEIAGRRRLVYLCKPLTTILILLLAAALPLEPGSRYRSAVLIGLLFSLAGDVLLMLPHDLFLAGVVAFLAAHIAYLTAFTSLVPLAASPAAWAAVAVVVAVILAALWRRLPARLRPALAAYAAVLGAMTAQAITQGVLVGSAAAMAGAAGGVLFLASDSALVTNRFARAFRLAPLLVLGTYYAAQVLIALSSLVTIR